MKARINWTVILILAVAAVGIYFVAGRPPENKEAGVLMIPKDGTPTEIGLAPPGSTNELDKATFRYVGGKYHSVSVDTTDGDGSVTSVARFDKNIYINGAYHLEVYWIRDTGNQIEIKYLVEPGEASIFRI